MGFTRVVDYSVVFQGISLIKFADTDPGAHQYPLWDTIIRDDCIEVLRCHFAGRFRSSVWGLLINSHSVCPADSAYLVVGADSSRIAEFCDLEKCKEWTVYAVFEEVERSKAKGDVFVMRPSGEVALVMSGVRFSIKTLEKILTAPDKASRHRNYSEKVAQLMSEQSRSTQLEDLLERATVDEDETRPQLVDPHSGQSIKAYRIFVPSSPRTLSSQVTILRSRQVLGPSKSTLWHPLN